MSSTDGQSPASPATTPVPPGRWIQELLQTPAVQQFVAFCLRTNTLDAEAERRVEEVLNAMRTRGSIQEAMWYLENNDWDVGQAVAQFNDDETARMQFNAATYDDMNEKANSVTWTNYHPRKLVFQVTENVGGQTHTSEYRFPRANGFNPNDTDHLHRLNQWRGDLVRWHGEGPPPALPQPTSPYTVFEKRFVRNLFAHRDYAAGEGPGFRQIVKEFNAIFQARYLPGSVLPCGPRKPGSTTNLVDRTWRLDNTPGRRTNQSNQRAAERIRQTRREEQQEHDQLLANSTQAEAAATLASAPTDLASVASDDLLFVQQNDGTETAAAQDDQPIFDEGDDNWPPQDSFEDPSTAQVPLNIASNMTWLQALQLQQQPAPPGSGEPQGHGYSEGEELSDGQQRRKRQRRG